MRITLRQSLIALALGTLLAPALAKGPAPSATAEAWRADVAALADAADNDARRAYLQQDLTASGLTVQALPFTIDGKQGTNLLAPVSGPANAPVLLIGAHLDRVDVGRGATDNASGSSVVLELAKRFQANPLKHHRVSVALWDLEEHGLLGARAYVEGDAEKPAFYVNFDVFGWGDSLWMMSPDAKHPLVAASSVAAEGVGLKLSAGPQYPPTDHLAFLKAGVPSVSYSLVGADEIPAILQVFAGGRPEQMPKVMQVIHSPDDTIDQVDPVAAAKGIDAVEAALRAWDATQGH